LTSTYNLAWQRGYFPEDFLLGDIVLLPKKGSPLPFANKRPITLLNSKYKIFAKVWQLRLTLVAQVIIEWNQSAFLPSPSIHHSVLLCAEVLDYVSLHSLPAVFYRLILAKLVIRFAWMF
jgi:hypothetical protein